MTIVVRNSYEHPTVQGLADVAVFCDVFRASTTLLTILSKSPQKVFLTNDEQTARVHVAQGALLFSEVFNGGYDNSPSQAETAPIAGKVVVHKSTNLTNAIFSSAIFHQKMPGRGFIGGIVNLKALVHFLTSLENHTCEIVAASHFGRKTEAVEDVACATMIAGRLSGAEQKDIPRYEEIQAKIEQKRQRGTYSSHYFDDVALALQIDRFNFLAEIKVINEHLMELERVDPYGERDAVQRTL